MSLKQIINFHKQMSKSFYADIQRHPTLNNDFLPVAKKHEKWAKTLELLKGKKK